MESSPFQIRGVQAQDLSPALWLPLAARYTTGPLANGGVLPLAGGPRVHGSFQYGQGHGTAGQQLVVECLSWAKHRLTG